MKIEIIRSDENSNREVVWTLTIDGQKMHEESQPDFIPKLVKGAMWGKTPVANSRMAEIKASV